MLLSNSLGRQVASLMDKYSEYLNDADDASAESTKMMREAMTHTQVRDVRDPCCQKVPWPPFTRNVWNSRNANTRYLVRSRINTRTAHVHCWLPAF